MGFFIFCPPAPISSANDRQVSIDDLWLKKGNKDYDNHNQSSGISTKEIWTSTNLLKCRLVSFLLLEYKFEND